MQRGRCVLSGAVQKGVHCYTKALKLSPPEYDSLYHIHTKVRTWLRIHTAAISMALRRQDVTSA